MLIPKEERPHISASQILTYLECPNKYMFQYELQLPWRVTPSALVFGGAIHRAIEYMNRQIMEGSTVSVDDVLSAFNKEWVSCIEGNNIHWKKPDESADLLTKGNSLLELYHEQFVKRKPKAVELEFRLPILDPDTGIFIESRDLVGKIDGIYGRNIVEIKTSSKVPAQLEMDSNLQLTLYSYAFRLLYGIPEENIVVVALVKTKEPKIEIIKTHRNGNSFSKAVSLIQRVIDCIDDKKFYPNQQNVWGCRSCVYLAECEKRGL